MADDSNDDDVISLFANWTTTSTTTILTSDSLGLVTEGRNSTEDDDAAGWRSRIVASMALVAVPAYTLIGSVIACLVVRWDARLHQTSYYFAVSMAVLHAVMAGTVMPAAVVATWQGEFRCSDSLCKLWITADLFFCNNTCLHLAFMNMDTFLRLKDPLRHGRNVTACSLLLWLGAPWTVSLVQSIAQFMLSQADADSRSRPGLCFIADKNFVLLGTLFSFAIPTVVAVGFAGLCRREIRALRDRVFCSSGSSTGLTVPGGGGEGTEEARGGAGLCLEDDEEEEGNTDFDYDESLNVTDSTLSDVESEERAEVRVCRDGLPEQLQLEAPTPLPNSHRGRRYTPTTPTAGRSEFPVDVTVNYEEDTRVLSTIDSSCSSYDRIQSAEHIIASCDDTLLLRDSTGGFHDSTDRARLMGDAPGAADRPLGADDFVSVPDQTLRHEFVVSRLSLLVMIVHVVLWVPFSVSNVVFGVCQPCRDAMTFAQSVTFKWAAYSSAAVGTAINLQVFDHVRQIY